MNRHFAAYTATELLPLLARYVLEEGEEVGSRNGRVKELLNVSLEIREPWNREVLTVGRKANIYAQIAETMWVLAGRNDIEWLSAYLPRASEFSDDGVTWRGGYGPRLRGQGGTSGWGDQLAHVVDLLKSDPLSRRAVIAIYDPARDMEYGKDIPCNDFLQFQSRGGKLHMTVTVRSNDLMWGWSGINTFEWSTIQEIVASLLGINVGPLIFNIGSLHIYDQHWERTRRFSHENLGYSSIRFNPDREITELSQVDDLIDQWFAWEGLCREGRVEPEMLEDVHDPLFCAWSAAIAYYWTRWSEWLDLLDGTALAAAMVRTPQSVLPEPVQASHGPGVGPGQGAALSDLSEAFYEFVSKLHATKHKSYGDSWKKRGEKMSILANIARKVDRLGMSDEYESDADTLIDLWVYLAKYMNWINGGDSGPDVVNEALYTGLRKIDGAQSDADHVSLEQIQIWLDVFLSTMQDSDIVEHVKRDFIARMMDQVLPIAVSRWETENPFWDGTITKDEADREIDKIYGPGAAAALDKAFRDGTVFSDSYRGADVD